MRAEPSKEDTGERGPFHQTDATTYLLNGLVGDIDGSTTVLCCGWYVDVAHPSSSVTRYEPGAVPS
jgi:hypothetical protein